MSFQPSDLSTYDSASSASLTVSSIATSPRVTCSQYLTQSVDDHFGSGRSEPFADSELGFRTAASSSDSGLGDEYLAGTARVDTGLSTEAAEGEYSEPDFSRTNWTRSDELFFNDVTGTGTGTTTPASPNRHDDSDISSPGNSRIARAYTGTAGSTFEGGYTHTESHGPDSPLVDLTSLGGGAYWQDGGYADEEEFNRGTTTPLGSATGTALTSATPRSDTGPSDWHEDLTDGGGTGRFASSFVPYSGTSARETGVS